MRFRRVEPPWWGGLGRTARAWRLLRRVPLARHPVAAAGIISALIIGLVVFRTGTFLASGDVAPMVVDGLEAELGWQWTHQTTGAGGPTYEIARTAEVVAARLGQLLSGTEALGQRLLYSAIWGFAAAAGAALAARFTRRGLLSMLIGVGTALNLFTLIAQPNPLPILAIAVTAGFAVVAIDAARDGRVRWVALAALTVPCSYLSLNPPLLAVVAATALVMPAVAPVLAGTGWAGMRRVLRTALLGAPGAVALSLWWTVPAAIAIRRADPTAKGAITDADAWSWTHARSSLQNVVSLLGHWSWPRAEYYGRAIEIEAMPWRWIRFVAPATVVVALVVVPRRRRAAAWTVAAAVAVCTLVGKGLHRPWRGLNSWAYTHVPGFWLLREPVAKIGVLLVLCFAVTTALAGEALAERAAALQARRRRRAGAQPGPALLRALAVGLAAVPIVGVWPLWTGAVISPASDAGPGDRVALPPAWRDVASVINGSPGRAKCSSFPSTTSTSCPRRGGTTEPTTSSAGSSRGRC